MEMDALKALLNNDDRFCRYNGMRIDVLRLGYAEAVMDITENSLNGLGIAQGGSIFTLADLLPDDLDVFSEIGIDVHHGCGNVIFILKPLIYGFICSAHKPEIYIVVFQLWIYVFKEFR